jgi:hypothetical protein
MLIFCSLIHFGRFFLIFLRGKINKGSLEYFIYSGSRRFYPSVMYLTPVLPSAPTRTAGIPACLFQQLTPNF